MRPMVYLVTDDTTEFFTGVHLEYTSHREWLIWYVEVENGMFHGRRVHFSSIVESEIWYDGYHVNGAIEGEEINKILVL